MCHIFFFSSRRRHTRYALVTGVQTCALPISDQTAARLRPARAAGDVGPPAHLEQLYLRLGRRHPAPASIRSGAGELGGRVQSLSAQHAGGDALRTRLVRRGGGDRLVDGDVRGGGLGARRSFPADRRAFRLLPAQHGDDALLAGRGAGALWLALRLHYPCRARGGAAGCRSCGPGPAFLWHVGKSLEFKKTRVADGVTRVRAVANAARSQAACDLMTDSIRSNVGVNETK